MAAQIGRRALVPAGRALAFLGVLLGLGFRPCV
jgi:hypothetical protein